MNNVCDNLFQYIYHETEISSIECEGFEIRLNFDKGIYRLDDKQRKTFLSNPMQMILTVDTYYSSNVEAFFIREYGKKTKFIEYLTLKKYLEKNVFQINLAYYSDFDNCILFEGGLSNSNNSMYLSISGVKQIVFKERSEN